MNRLIFFSFLPLLSLLGSQGIPPLKGKTYTIAFAPNSSFAEIRDKMTGKGIIHLRENTPLWELKFVDGSSLTSLDIPRERFSWEAKGSSRLFHYKSDVADVDVGISPKDDGVDISFILHPKSKTILTLRCPILRFPPEEIEKVYVPEGLGIAFTRGFFTEEIGWVPQVIGDQGLRSVVGEGCLMRPVADEPVPIRLTEEGKEWLGEDIGEKIEGHNMMVNRPPEGKVEVVNLVDSPNGALLSGYRVGEGWLFRLGGWVKREDGDVVFLLFQRVVEHIWQNPGRQKTVAILDIAGGPKGGAFNELLPAIWEDKLPSLLPSFKLRKLSTVEEMVDALNHPDDYPLIINPYGEYIPTGKRGGWKEVLPAIKGYLEKGGIWWETGGFSFYYELVPRVGGFWHTDYPPAFSDFLHLQSSTGSLSIYGIQRKTDIFVPVSLEVGREGEDALLLREWHTYVKVGDAWSSPIVRMSFGVPLLTAFKKYGEENGFNKRLKEKLPLRYLRS